MKVFVTRDTIVGLICNIDSEAGPVRNSGPVMTQADIDRKYRESMAIPVAGFSVYPSRCYQGKGVKR